MMRPKITSSCLALFVLVAVLLSGPLCAFASAGPEDIRVVPYKAPEGDLGAGGYANYSWRVYNNDSEDTHFVYITCDSDSEEWTVSTSAEHLTIQPKEDAFFDVHAIAPMDDDDPEVAVSLGLHFTDDGTDYTWTETRTLHLNMSGAGDLPKILGQWDNPLPDPLDGRLGVFVLEASIWVLALLAVLLILRPLFHALTKKSETEIDDMIWDIIKGPIVILVLFYGIKDSLEVLDLSYSVVNTIEKAWGIVFILVMTWIAYKIFRDVLVYVGHRIAAKTETELDDILIPVLEKVGIIVVLAFCAIFLLSYFGMDVTLLLAGMGVLGMVIGFATQQSLGNLISGFFLLTDRPFKVGDLVQLETGEICTVKYVGMRTTKLYNGANNSIVIVPNSDMANKKVVNLSAPDSAIRTSVDVGVAYGTDVEKTKAIIEDILQSYPNVLKDKAHTPIVRFEQFGDSALLFTAYFWVNDINEHWQLKSDIREQINRRFTEAGIEIPFPQRVVHMMK